MKTNTENSNQLTVKKLQSNLITFEFFQKTLLKLIKALKSDYICILPGCIVGTNDELSQISVIRNVFTGVPDGAILELPYQLISDFSKEAVEDSDIYQELFIRSRQYGGHPMLDTLAKIESSIMAKNNIPDIFISNLKENDNFNRIMSYKAEMGASALKIGEDSIIFIYKQLIPCNKPDKISLSYYKVTDNMAIAQFNIDKKFCIMDRYVCYLTK